VKAKIQASKKELAREVQSLKQILFIVVCARCNGEVDIPKEEALSISQRAGKFEIDGKDGNIKIKTWIKA
jgi:hypothetical protein